MEFKVGDRVKATVDIDGFYVKDKLGTVVKLNGRIS